MNKRKRLTPVSFSVKTASSIYNDYNPTRTSDFLVSMLYEFIDEFSSYTRFIFRLYKTHDRGDGIVYTLNSTSDLEELTDMIDSFLIRSVDNWIDFYIEGIRTNYEGKE